MTGRYKQAVAVLREAVRLDPGYAAAHSDLGMALLNAGHYKQAETAFREAIRLDPACEPAQRNLAKILRLHERRSWWKNLPASRRRLP